MNIHLAFLSLVLLAVWSGESYRFKRSGARFVHPYFSIPERLPCKLTVLRDSPRPFESSLNSTLALFRDPSSFPPLLSRFNSTTLRLLLLAQGEVGDLVARLEGRLVSLGLSLGAKVQRDLRATRGAADFLLRSVRRGGEEVRGRLVGLSEGLGELGEGGERERRSSLLGGLGAVSTRQRARRQREEGGKGRGGLDLYRTLRLLPQQVRYDFERQRRRRGRGEAGEDWGEERARALPSSIRREEEREGEEGSFLLQATSLLDCTEKIYSAPVSPPLAVPSPSSSPLSVLLPPPLLLSLSQALSLLSAKEEGEEARERLREGARACSVLYEGEGEGGREGQAIRRGVEEAVRALGRGAFSPSLSPLSPLLLQLKMLAQELAEREEGGQQEREDEREWEDSPPLLSLPVPLSLLDVEEEEGRDGAITFLPCSFSPLSPSSPPLTSSVGVVDTTAEEVERPGERVARRALLLLDFSLFFVERLLSLLLPLLLERGQGLRERLGETFDVWGRRRGGREGGWELLPHFRREIKV